MIHVHCNCGKVFAKRSEKEKWTGIYACPYCKKGWRLTKYSGIKWKVYPILKQLVESYIHIK